MSDLTLTEATANIYTSLQNDNADLDLHIAALKSAMARAGAKRPCSKWASWSSPTGRAANSWSPTFARRASL